MEEAKSDPLQKMKDFIGYDKVRKFKELLTIVDGGVVVVVAWFVSVDEGVDCWFPDVDVNVNVKSKLRLIFILHSYYIKIFIFSFSFFSLIL
jgi:hypothetical protein